MDAETGTIPNPGHTQFVVSNPVQDRTTDGAAARSMVAMHGGSRDPRSTTLGVTR